MPLGSIFFCFATNPIAPAKHARVAAREQLLGVGRARLLAAAEALGLGQLELEESIRRFDPAVAALVRRGLCRVEHLHASPRACWERRDGV
jgi:hypothetical protein